MYHHGGARTLAHELVPRPLTSPPPLPPPQIDNTGEVGNLDENVDEYVDKDVGNVAE